MKKMKYLSERYLFVLCIILGVLIGTVVLHLILWVRGDTTGMGLLAVCSLIVLFSFLNWFYLVKDYRESEKRIQRFLEGYTWQDKEEEIVFFTPSSEQMLEQMCQMLYSPEVYDLNKKQAQYLALQNQINPHFLYNTLESVRSEALIAGLDSVSDMTEALAIFFRYTISKVENLVTLEEEIESCKTYFRIQKYRFGNRLVLNIQYDESDWNWIRYCKVPKLTLQPILENSIIHGTESKVGTGHLEIQLGCSEKRLLIRISDDGVGMDEAALWALNKKLRVDRSHIAYKGATDKGGIALVNVNNRIHLLFGEAYGIHVYAIQGKGTDVEISIPIIKSNQETKECGIES